jgi:ABC-2 type transport system permease protein
MSTLAVAKKDFNDAIRSRGLWALSVLFFLLVTAVAVAYAQVDELAGGDPSATGLIFFVASTVGTYVALAALLACFKAVAGERETGTIKILLSLPHSRRDVVLGKLLGRTAVLAIPVVGTFVVGVAIGGALMGAFDTTATVLLAAMTLLFAATYASVYVGISALSDSDTRVTLLAVGFFVVFEMLWSVVGLVLLFVANGLSMPSAPFPAWYWLLNRVPPSAAFTTSLEAVIPGAGEVAMGGAGAGGGSAAQFDAMFANPWLGLAILAFWAVVPLAIGYRRFKHADL